jgi:prephenate dehydratase
MSSDANPLFQRLAGALAAAINSFSAHGINLLALESFPHKTEPWQYNFFVEIGGHPSDEPVKRAFDDLRKVTSFVHIIGAFPRKELL